MKSLRSIANFVLKIALMLITIITVLYTSIWFDTSRSWLCDFASSIITTITEQKTEIKNVKVYGYIIPSFSIEKIKIGDFIKANDVIISLRYSGVESSANYFEINLDSTKKQTESNTIKEKDLHALIEKTLAYSKILKLIFCKITSTTCKCESNTDIAGRIFINGDCVTVSSYSYTNIDGISFHLSGSAKSESSIYINRNASDKYTGIKCNNFFGNTFFARIEDLGNKSYAIDFHTQKILETNFNARIKFNTLLSSNCIYISDFKVESPIFGGFLVLSNEPIVVDDKKLVGNFVLKSSNLSDRLEQYFSIEHQNTNTIELVMSGEANFFDDNKCKFSLKHGKENILNGIIEFGALFNINSNDIILYIDKIPNGIKISDIKTKTIDQVSVRLKNAFKEIISDLKIGDTKINTQLEIQDGTLKLKELEANGSHLKVQMNKKKTLK